LHAKLVIPIFVANWRVKHETEIIPARRDSLPDNLGQFSAFDIRIHRAVIFAFMGISAIAALMRSRWTGLMWPPIETKRVPLSGNQTA